MALSKNLQQIRKDKGLKQEELAELAGVSLTQISKIERDEADPRVSTVEKLAKALECSTSKLLFNEDGESLDGLLKRSFEQIKKLSPGDKAAVLKVMNMAYAGGTVLRTYDEIYDGAEEEAERVNAERKGFNVTADEMLITEMEVENTIIEMDNEYHDRIDRLAEEESKRKKSHP